MANFSTRIGKLLYFSVIGEIYVLRINDNFFFFFGLVMWRTKQSNRHIAITLSYYEKNTLETVYQKFCNLILTSLLSEITMPYIWYVKQTVYTNRSRHERFIDRRSCNKNPLIISVTYDFSFVW